VIKEFRRKAASPCCHPSRRWMDLSDLDLHPDMFAWAHIYVNPAKRHLDRFSCVFVHRSKCFQCFSMGRTTHQNCPFY